MANDLKILQLTYKIMKHGPLDSEIPHDTQLLFEEILSLTLSNRFSEQWYLSEHPDVSVAVANREIESGLVHFVTQGVYEGRMPFQVTIDERNYASSHLDVAKSVNAKVYKSCADHYHKIGYHEGRRVIIVEPS